VKEETVIQQVKKISNGFEDIELTTKSSIHYYKNNRYRNFFLLIVA